MTSTTDTAGHPDVEEISDLTEGLLPPSRTADVRRHLDDCALCCDVYDSLEEIRGLLGTLPGATRMPDDVAERIDAALAAEALLSATVPEARLSATVPDTAERLSATATADDIRAAAPNDDSTTDTDDVSRETSPADRPAGHGRAATGPGRARRGRRVGRRTATLGAVFGAAALGLGALLVQTLGGGGGTGTSAAHTDAAHTYTDGTLQKQVKDLLTADENSGGQAASDNPLTAQTDSNTGMKPKNSLEDSVVELPACVDAAISDNLVVLAADKGVYKGTAVYLVVTRDSASNSSEVTAHIVDSACVKQASAAAGKVLLTHAYPRA
ncbi:hypothetical protein OK074_3856 [Actinobacteria bacterium OK074]|nr:hypothetical protein OK074_3856 [Actinobacteria bacterium OK074]